MIRTLIITTTLASVLAFASPAAADEGCTIGDYQGAPIEICLPTGEQLPEGSTYRGEPVVYHVSKDYVAPVVEVAPVQEAASAVDWMAPITSKSALFAQKFHQ